MRLTATQEDYLETIYWLGKSNPGVRITDIAKRLGCRQPTVTRAVRKLVAMKLIKHESYGLVSLSRTGQSTAENIAHRHADIVTFLTTILKLSRKQAEEDACQIEHGFSPLAAQRLHEFLEYVDNLDMQDHKVINKFLRRVSSTTADFPHLLTVKSAGWRR